MKMWVKIKILNPRCLVKRNRIFDGRPWHGLAATHGRGRCCSRTNGQYIHCTSTRRSTCKCG